KASAIRFQRLDVPMLFGALFASMLDLALGEVVPLTNQRRSQLLQEDKAQVGTSRFNFAFASDLGRVYKAYELRTDSGQIRQLQIERKGQGPTYPTYMLTADPASYDARGRAWTLRHGHLQVVSDRKSNFAISFASARDNHFTEHPGDMMAKPRDPQDMRYDELTRFITALERSGGDA